MIEVWAEAGPCDNSVAAALQYVDAVHQAGAAAIKVQWYNADTLVTPDAPRYDNTSGKETTQYAMFKKGIYPYERWESVISRSRDLGIEFIPSVFDHEAIEYAEDAGIKTIKIASGDITYLNLIRHASSFAERIAISTGASTLDEVADALDAVQPGCEAILMACHLEYPTPLTRANIARTYDLQQNFPDCVPGFSDHTPGIASFPLIAATGCQVIEKHFTLEAGKGYDSDFALTPADLRNGVLSLERTLALMGDIALSPTPEEAAGRQGARRSLYTRRAIPAGQTVNADDIAVLRPGGGLHPEDKPLLAGMAPLVDLPKFHQLAWADFGIPG